MDKRHNTGSNKGSRLLGRQFIYGHAVWELLKVNHDQGIENANWTRLRHSCAPRSPDERAVRDCVRHYPHGRHLLVHIDSLVQLPCLAARPAKGNAEGCV